MDWMRSVMTVVAFLTFIGIVWWAWSARKQGDFELAARSILNEDDCAAALVNVNDRHVRGGRHE